MISTTYNKRSFIIK